MDAIIRRRWVSNNSGGTTEQCVHWWENEGDSYIEALGPKCYKAEKQKMRCRKCRRPSTEIIRTYYDHDYVGSAPDSWDWHCKYCGEPTHPGSGS